MPPRKPKPTPIEPPYSAESILLGEFVATDFISSDFIVISGDFIAINFTSHEFLVD